jgi:hypothetical protein
VSRAPSRWGLASCILRIILVMSINAGWRIDPRRYATPGRAADGAVATVRSSRAWGCIVGVTRLCAGKRSCAGMPARASAAAAA